MIKVIKASAGSGKTFNLALEYIRLILSDPDPSGYRHILAVTFTNKATEEMKNRILKELHLLATEPSESKYRDKLIKGDNDDPGIFTNETDLKNAAGLRLRRILHDYSAFAVSTIDKFFQRALKAFSREIGRFASYQVDLDRDALVEEAVDRILDGLGDGDGKVLEWLSKGVADQIERGEKFNLEGGLYSMAKSLTSDAYREKVRQWGIDEKKACSQEKLSAIRDACNGIIKAFADEVGTAASDVVKCFESHGVGLGETARGYMGKILVYRDLKKGARVDIGDAGTIIKNGLEPEKWFPAKSASLRDVMKGELEAPLGRFIDLFGEKYQVYSTALIIRDQLVSLGLIREIRSALDDVQKEKNVMNLEESNSLLRDIIDGSDAPFVYEKLGVRYTSFLLDEFQDTSRVQWDNFLPLLKESEANAGDKVANLIVGDVKQSIYRWRGSDWRLLAESVPAEFPEIKDKDLKGNYRTLGEIVRFNNRFFSYAKGRLAQTAAVYDRLEQEVMVDDPAPGSVELSFCEDPQAQLNEILQGIKAVEASGGKPGDVAVLVRSNKAGSAVADFLIKNGIGVVSDDSLLIRSSFLVRILVSMLHEIDKPSLGDGPGSAAGFLARENGIVPPEGYRSLTDLCEGIIRELLDRFPERAATETGHLLAFMDFVQDRVAVHGNRLSAVLRDWEEKDDRAIASPKTSSAVKVMTIHKAKGLEFPFVILPFLEKIKIHDTERRWCVPSVKGTPLELVSDSLFDVSISESTSRTCFSGDYSDKVRLEEVDSLNLLYVAMTRPQRGLRLIASYPSAKYRKDGGEAGNMSQLLWDFSKDGSSALLPGGFGAPAESGGTRRFRLGLWYDYGTMKREDESHIPLEFCSFPPEEGGGERPRLNFSPEAADYFGEDGTAGAKASARIRGLVLHGILSDTVSPGDVDSAVRRACLRGDLETSEAEAAAALLKDKISKAPARWFPSDASKVLREVTVIDPSAVGTGSYEHRPDRVVITPEGIEIIDYKTGHPESGYRRQVARYMALFRRMQPSPVRGWIWYINASGEDVFEEV